MRRIGELKSSVRKGREEEIMWRSCRNWAAVALALLVLFGAPAAAQISTATVEVQVTGTDGAALPGVTVTLENAETGLTHVDVTDADGAVTLPALPPGTYRG